MFSSFDIGASLPTTMLRAQIQVGHRLFRSQAHRQQQLCVPLVVTDGDSYRMKQARGRGGTKIKTS